MTPEALDIIDRLIKAFLFVPILAIIGWWLFTNWMERVLDFFEFAIGMALLAVALVLGWILIWRGGWGFLGVLAVVYLIVLGVACWEYIYWRKREREHKAAEVERAKRNIEIDPKNAAAYSLLGASLLAQGLFEEAIAALEQALKLDPDSKKDRSLLNRARSGQAQLPRKWAD